MPGKRTDEGWGYFGAISRDAIQGEAFTTRHEIVEASTVGITGPLGVQLKDTTCGMRKRPLLESLTHALE
jgi:hypothetical protein